MNMRAVRVQDVAYIAIPDLVSTLTEFADKLDSEDEVEKSSVVRDLVGNLLVTALYVHQARVV